MPLPPTSTLFPYTTLFRSSLRLGRAALDHQAARHLGGDLSALAAVLVVASRATERRSEEHTSELQSLRHLVCRLLLEKKKKTTCKLKHREKNKHTQSTRAQ